MERGYYYLHENGQLIFKRDLGDTAADLEESDLVKAFWPINTGDRQSAWDLLVELLASGVNRERIHELSQKWGCNDNDAPTYAERVGAKLFKDGDFWCATRKDFIDLQQSPAGFGDTALEALGKLCKALGFKPHKIWGNRFTDLLK